MTVSFRLSWLSYFRCDDGNVVGGTKMSGGAFIAILDSSVTRCVISVIRVKGACEQKACPPFMPLLCEINVVCIVAVVTEETVQGTFEGLHDTRPP